MKNSKFLLIVSIVFALCAFSRSTNNLEAVIGDYGVKSSSHIKLSILEDHTFHYYNVSDPKQKVDVKGKWSLEKNKIILTDYGTEVSIHDKWKMEDDCNCIKSRKGLNFYRICVL